MPAGAYTTSASARYGRSAFTSSACAGGSIPATPQYWLSGRSRWTTALPVARRAATSSRLRSRTRSLELEAPVSASHSPSTPSGGTPASTVTTVVPGRRTLKHDRTTSSRCADTATEPKKRKLEPFGPRRDAELLDQREERLRVGRAVRPLAHARPVDLLPQRAGDLEHRAVVEVLLGQRHQLRDHDVVERRDEHSHRVHLEHLGAVEHPVVDPEAARLEDQVDEHAVV